LGRRIAERWQNQGSDVCATTRSSERAAEFRRRGWQPLEADVTRPETLPPMSGFQTIVFAVGHDRTADAPLHQVYVAGLANVVARITEPPQSFIYISSTGVYGNWEGATVDETTACRPDREGGRACLEAEQLLLTSRLADRTIVLRLAGIYGPGRIPRRAEITAGRPLAAADQGYLNLIHVEDAADIVLAAEACTERPQLFVVADGQPVQRGDYYRELARLLAAPPPTFVAPDAESPAARRATGSRRVDSAKMMRDLVGHPGLRFPSYREGLAAIVAAEDRAK
jgi:nucleoside-diphosphate-sugar epimerase